MATRQNSTNGKPKSPRIQVVLPELICEQLTILANNEYRTVAIAIKNGSTPYYFNAFEIDGSAVTPLWSGGSAPSAGNASSTDFYTFSIVKTGSATFEVYGTFTKYA